MVKYPHWVQNYYIIRHNMRTAAILIFDKCLSQRQTTANNCETAFSLKAVSQLLAVVCLGDQPRCRRER